MVSLLHPRDTRWQGPQRWYFAIDLFKNTVLLFFVILVIVETALHRKWYNSYHSTVEYDSDETAMTFFFRIGIPLLLDIFSIILTWSLLPALHFHPVYALTQSLVLFCVYPIILTFNVIIVVSDEDYIDNFSAWRQLCYGEMGMQALLMVCWAGLVGCGCVAVHRWRGVKKERVLRGVVRDELELKDAGARKDSASADVERDGLVGGSLKSSRVFV